METSLNLFFKWMNKITSDKDNVAMKARYPPKQHESLKSSWNTIKLKDLNMILLVLYKNDFQVQRK